MNRRDFLLAALALPGCATAPKVVSTGTEVLEELEPLYDVRADRRGLAFRIASGGCATKADIAFYVERRGEGTSLAFAHRPARQCDVSTSDPLALRFSWAELGLPGHRRVILLNASYPMVDSFR